MQIDKIAKDYETLVRFKRQQQHKIEAENLARQHEPKPGGYRRGVEVMQKASPNQNVPQQQFNQQHLPQQFNQQPNMPVNNNVGGFQPKDGNMVPLPLKFRRRPQPPQNT